MFHKLACSCAVFVVLSAFSDGAKAACSVPNTLTNGTTADATQVMANFTSITGCAAPLASPAFTGNVGITGTGSGTSLDVQAPTNAFIRSKATSGGGGYLQLDRWSSVGNAAINFYTGGTADWEVGVAPGIGNDAFTFYSHGTNTNVFTIVKSNGYVGINTTSPSYNLHVNGSVAGTSAYNNLSDARLKKNIAPVTSGLALIGQLQPVRFDWRSVGEREIGKGFNLPAGRQIGFIAQDIGKVLPEAVSTAKGKDAIMSVAESKIVPVLVTAVKELKTANDNQAAEITRLESQMAILQRKLGVQAAAK